LEIDTTNDWKFQIAAIFKKKAWMRSKIYCKPTDQLTSKGVENNKTEDPLADLLLPNKHSTNTAKRRYKKNIFCTD